MNAVNILIAVRLVVLRFVLCAFHFTVIVLRDGVCCHLYVAHFIRTEWYLVPIKTRPPSLAATTKKIKYPNAQRPTLVRDVILYCLSAADEMI